VRNLMITWDDIPSIANRSMQEALRSIEPARLAVALFGASDAIAKKIRSNISERMTAALDEEISLMQDPTEKEVLDAREEVVSPLRDANEQGTLRVIGR
jgi:flagellar motor switch protein FliG